MKLDQHLGAVVSGGASGLGEATVRALRALDVKVAILDRDTERGTRVASETGAIFAAVDVTDETNVLQAFASVREHQGQERVLIHTPGGGGFSHTAWRDANNGNRRHDFPSFERTVKLNLSGSFLCASVSAAGMLSLAPDDEGERGVIVMTSSVASQDAPAGIAAYVAAKAGINGMTLAMAKDPAPEGIRVNTIVPGSFDTPLNAAFPRDFKDAMVAWTLHPKRLGRPSEYASAALELVRNTYFNAALLRIDGGARI